MASPTSKTGPPRASSVLLLRAPTRRPLDLTPGPPPKPRPSPGQPAPNPHRNPPPQDSRFSSAGPRPHPQDRDPPGRRGEAQAGGVEPAGSGEAGGQVGSCPAQRPGPAPRPQRHHNLPSRPARPRGGDVTPGPPSPRGFSTVFLFLLQIEVRAALPTPRGSHRGRAPATNQGPHPQCTGGEDERRRPARGSNPVEGLPRDDSTWGWRRGRPNYDLDPRKRSQDPNPLPKRLGVGAAVHRERESDSRNCRRWTPTVETGDLTSPCP